MTAATRTARESRHLSPTAALAGLAVAAAAIAGFAAGEAVAGPRAATVEAQPYVRGPDGRAGNQADATYSMPGSHVLVVRGPDGRPGDLTASPSAAPTPRALVTRGAQKQ
jgi:hypothetical protein